jgi:thioesterase domain-containing protein
MSAITIPQLRDRLQQMLVREMPVSQRLGFSIEDVTAAAVSLRAEFGINRNHQGSAFAGSVNALATLAGWSTVWLTLQEAGLPANAVLQDSEIRYLHPIMTDFTATCIFPTAQERLALLDSVTRHRRGRVPVRVEVRARGSTVARFYGRYVALLPDVSEAIR